MESDARRAEPGATHRGVLEDRALAALLASGAIRREGGPDPARIQPCSLDLTLSAEAWRMQASVLPLPGESVRDVVAAFGKRRLDLSRPETLDRGKVYLVRLAESFALPPDHGAYANNKSSIGRLDLQTRLLTDQNPRFDKVANGYEGELWLEIVPRSFDVRLEAGLALNQILLHRGRRPIATEELVGLARREDLLFDASGTPIRGAGLRIDEGLLMSIDLEQDPVGYVARHTPEELSLAGSETPHNEAEAFFEPLPRPRQGRLLLRRGHFYILSTRERLRVPPGYAVEMVPYETSAGEFRAHYAGFFDPGFGWSPEGRGRGTPAVLEVRAYDDDLILRHGQPICRLAFEHLHAAPERPYGAEMGSHYGDQRGPTLSRFVSGD